MITTNDILKKAGIKARKTLTRWHQAKLIPAPTIGTSPSGRGKVAYWPDEVLGLCRLIRRMTDKGKSLDFIRAQLKAPKRRYDLKQACEIGDLQECKANLDELVWEKLIPLLTDLRDSFELGKKWTALAWAEGSTRILQLVRDGYNPVLVTDGKKCWVTPDFMVSQVLADEAIACPCMVMPIRKEVVAAFVEIEKSLPSAAQIGPAQKVVLSKDSANEERGFRPVGRTDFELLA